MAGRDTVGELLTQVDPSVKPPYQVHSHSYKTVLSVSTYAMLVDGCDLKDVRIDIEYDAIRSAYEGARVSDDNQGGYTEAHGSVRQPPAHVLHI